MIPFTYHWIEPGSVMAMSIPNSEADVRTVHAQGIRAILSINRRPLECHGGISEAFLRDLDIRHAHLPIVDGSLPTLVEVTQLLDFMLQARHDRRPFVVHCRWGIARTGVVLWLYFRAMGWPTSRIIPHFTMRRHSVDGVTALGPNNDAQRQFVGGWCEMDGTYHAVPGGRKDDLYEVRS